MKKLICAALAGFALAGCEDVQRNSPDVPTLPARVANWNYIGVQSYIRTVEVKGHEYIILAMDNYHGGGVSVIHSESCSCKNAK